MATFAQKARALQQAQDAAKAANTPDARKAVKDAQQALRQSPEAARARRSVIRVSLSPW